MKPDGIEGNCGRRIPPKRGAGTMAARIRKLGEERHDDPVQSQGHGEGWRASLRRGAFRRLAGACDAR
jgi:hypothetical protein